MAIMVLLQKTRASYVPRFNFGGPLFDEKSDFQIANFRFFRIFAEIADFSKYYENYSFSDGYWLLVIGGNAAVQCICARTACAPEQLTLH